MQVNGMRSEEIRRSANQDSVPRAIVSSSSSPSKSCAMVSSLASRTANALRSLLRIRTICFNYRHYCRCPPHGLFANTQTCAWHGRNKRFSCVAEGRETLNAAICGPTNTGYARGRRTMPVLERFSARSCTSQLRRKDPHEQQDRYNLPARRCVGTADCRLRRRRGQGSLVAQSFRQGFGNYGKGQDRTRRRKTLEPRQDQSRYRQQGRSQPERNCREPGGDRQGRGDHARCQGRDVGAKRHQDPGRQVSRRPLQATGETNAETRIGSPLFALKSAAVRRTARIGLRPVRIIRMPIAAVRNAVVVTVPAAAAQLPAPVVLDPFIRTIRITVALFYPVPFHPHVP